MLNQHWTYYRGHSRAKKQYISFISKRAWSYSNLPSSRNTNKEWKFLKNHSSWFEAQPWNFHQRQIEFYFSTLWRFSNLVAFLMFSPWTSSCPIVYKAVIWTSGLDFYTSTKCSSDKSCLFFFSTKAFVLNYATKGKVLCGASCEICAKRHLGNIKTKE